MRAVIVHCWTGTPSSGWYPDLAQRLQRMGFEVNVPALPRTEDPDPVQWHDALDAVIREPGRDLVLVGHSLGALAVLRWLATMAAPVAGAVLVAPPIGPSPVAVVNRFLVTGSDLPIALPWARRSVVVVSDEDKYLLPSPTAVGDVFQRAGAERLILPGRGHFSPASGLKSIPELEPAITIMAADMYRP